MMRNIYRSIGTAKATDTTLSASIKSKKGKDMDTETVTHGLVLLVIHMKKLHIRALLRQLAHLGMQSLASPAARGEEVNHDELIASVGERVDEVLRRRDLSHVLLQAFLPPLLSCPNPQRRLY